MKRPGNKWWTESPGPKDYDIQAMGYATPCWVWKWGKTGQGYGYLSAGVDGVRSMHRWFYMQKFGEIRQGLQLDHLCRVRACVNPDHLEPVTGAENTRRGPHVKLTQLDVQTIRAAKGSGVPARWLATKFGVSNGTIHELCNGRSWQAPGKSKKAVKSGPRRCGECGRWFRHVEAKFLLEGLSPNVPLIEKINRVLGEKSTGSTPKK